MIRAGRLKDEMMCRYLHRNASCMHRRLLFQDNDCNPMIQDEFLQGNLVNAECIQELRPEDRKLHIHYFSTITLFENIKVIMNDDFDSGVLITPRSH